MGDLNKLERTYLVIHSPVPQPGNCGWCEQTTTTNRTARPKCLPSEMFAFSYLSTSSQARQGWIRLSSLTALETRPSLIALSPSGQTRPFKLDGSNLWPNASFFRFGGHETSDTGCSYLIRVGGKVVPDGNDEPKAARTHIQPNQCSRAEGNGQFIMYFKSFLRSARMMHVRRTGNVGCRLRALRRGTVYYSRCTPMFAGYFYSLTPPPLEKKNRIAYLVELPTKRDFMQRGRPSDTRYGLIERSPERQPPESDGPNGPLSVDTLVERLPEGEALKTERPFHLEQKNTTQKEN